MFAMLLKQLTSLTTFRLELSHVTVLKAEVAGLTDRQLGFVVDNLQNLETLSISRLWVMPGWNFVTGKGLNGLEKLEKLRALTICRNGGLRQLITP
jgi:hypothetical protein